MARATPPLAAAYRTALAATERPRAPAAAAQAFLFDEVAGGIRLWMTPRCIRSPDAGGVGPEPGLGATSTADYEAARARPGTR